MIAFLASFTANVEALFNALYLAFRSRTSSTGLNLSVLISEDGKHFAAELDCFKGSGWGGALLTLHPRVIWVTIWGHLKKKRSASNAVVSTI